LASVDGGWHVVVSLDQVGLIVALGLFATLGQLAMTRAYRTGQTVVVASFAYSTVVFASVLDALFFNEKMPLLAWIGICITVLAGVQAARLNERVSK
jgi:drug/metabolite transporter (DMT)-like permease